MPTLHAAGRYVVVDYGTHAYISDCGWLWPDRYAPATFATLAHALDFARGLEAEREVMTTPEWEQDARDYEAQPSRLSTLMDELNPARRYDNAIDTIDALNTQNDELRAALKEACDALAQLHDAYPDCGRDPQGRACRRARLAMDAGRKLLD